MAWKRMRFKHDQKVYAEVDDTGELVDREGRVRICFREGDDRTYDAARRNLTPLDATPPPRPSPPPEAAVIGDEELELLASTPGNLAPIIIHTDGACRGNPGPAGYGAVLTCGTRRKELSGYLGRSTNNVAELTAIQKALEAVQDRQRRVIVYVDSEYALGVLTKGWKVRANRQLIGQLRQLLTCFPDLHFLKVAAHAGIAENERADQLATGVIERATPPRRSGRRR
jgi:ribonuclease HI